MEDAKNYHFKTVKLTALMRVVVPNNWEYMNANERRRYIRQLQRKHYTFRWISKR